MSRERADILEAKKVLADVWPGQVQADSVALLKALHILTRDGALNHDARRKLKQVLHLVQLLRPSLDAVLGDAKTDDRPFVALDIASFVELAAPAAGTWLPVALGTAVSAAVRCTRTPPAPRSRVQYTGVLLFCSRYVRIATANALAASAGSGLASRSSTRATYSSRSNRATSLSLSRNSSPSLWISSALPLANSTR